MVPVAFVLPPPVFSGTVVIFTKAKRKRECWVLGFQPSQEGAGIELYPRGSK